MRTFPLGLPRGSALGVHKNSVNWPARPASSPSPWLTFVQRKRALALEEEGSAPPLSQAPGLTSEEILDGLLHHFLADLRVGDGVEQMPPVGLVKDQVPQDLAVDVTILQQDLSAEGLHDVPVGGVSWLDDCGRRRGWVTL